MHACSHTAPHSLLTLSKQVRSSPCLSDPVAFCHLAHSQCCTNISTPPPHFLFFFFFCWWTTMTASHLAGGCFACCNYLKAARKAVWACCKCCTQCFALLAHLDGRWLDQLMSMINGKYDNRLTLQRRSGSDWSFYITFFQGKCKHKISLDKLKYVGKFKLNLYFT